REAKGEHALPALQESIDEVFERRIGDVSGRGKLAADMREIWVMQPRFEKRAGRVPESMVAQLRFRAGFDFMRLRADIGEVDEALASWWQEYSTADEYRRHDLMEQAREEQKSRGRTAPPTVRRVPRDAAVQAGGSDAAPAPAEHAEGFDTGAPKKRRRRRRKPTGGGGEASTGQPNNDAPHGDD
ncbi:MAG: polynucleotide adenylyltransferase PcnB, partial [Giesbergeria sp.]